jgi:hypothetical protein
MSDQDPQVLLKRQIEGIFPGLKTALVAAEDSFHDTVEKTAKAVQKVNPDAVEIGRQGDILIHRGLLTA